MSNNTTYENSFFKIGLFNANGLTYEAIDNIINYLPLHTNILFITETWLLSPRRLNTDWEQQNTYGTKRLNSYTGQDGLSYIVHPGFPFPVIPIINNNPQHNKYTISCRIQNLIIHCFYLPPRVSDSLCMTIIQSFIDQYDVIFCGDFNARMGILTGDYRTTNTTQTPRTNNRGNLMLPLIINNGLTLWNEKLCYGIPTYLTGTTNSTTNVKSSIIDFFLTTTTDKFLCPEMSIATDLSLGSDHKLVTFGFQYQFNQPTVTTEQQHPRKLWKIKKLKPKEKRYINNYRDKIIFFFQNRVEPLFEQPSPSINLINTTIVESIQQALDSSVGEQKKRKKHWRWFWNEHLQEEATKREQLYKKWNRAHGINKIEYWKSHLEQSEKVRSLIKQYKNKYFRSFCNKLLTDEYSKTLQKLKTIRRSRDKTVTFQNENGPAAAAEIMVTKLNNIFKGPQDNILATLDRYPDMGPSIFDGINTGTNITTESTQLDENGNSLPFTLWHIQQAIEDLPTNKAPGIDHLKAEMFKPINEHLSKILFKFYDLCWKQGKTPKDWNHYGEKK
ncbi:hypothetical protein BDF21DRAFT_350955 [Thamnidium elegans]|nr:hypothetical protein BDF21DRAFT_350955 [Thamnidium elegans]